MPEQLSRILIGGMRFTDRAGAVATVRAAIDAGFNYIDSSPCYCFKSEEENSERWIGEAIDHPEYRDRVMISAKCSTGNGGWQLGDFNGEKGFGVRSEEELRQVFDQSRERIGVERFDYYHLWTVHTMEQLEEALKPGGWYDGVRSRSDAWGQLGVTTHANSATAVEFLKTGKFQIITIPFNVVNTVRRDVVEYCQKNGITVIAMNPLAGGFLAAHQRLKELALRYLLSIPGVHPLIGFSSPEEVKYAKWILDTQNEKARDPEQILGEVESLINADEPRCTACGYCQPCPEGITVGAALSYYNVYKYMGMPEAKDAFNKKQWEDGLRLDKCRQCGLCEQRCPNKLPVSRIIRDAQAALYDS